MTVAFRCLAFLAAVTIIASCKSVEAKYPTGQDGLFDYSKWDFKEEGLLPIEGHWKYLWNEKITNIDQWEQNQQKDLDSLYVPGFWRLQNAEFLNDKPYGLMSIYGQFKLPDADNQYMIKLKSVVSAYEIWANGELLVKNGVVSDVKTESIPQFQARLVKLPNSEDIDLFFIISNHHHQKGGGTWEPIKIGTEEQILDSWKSSFGFEVFSATVILIIGVYHLAMFLFYPLEKSYLYFSLAVLMVVLRTITTGEIIIAELISDFPYGLIQKFRYIGYYLPIGILPVFLYYYLERKRKTLVNICLGISLLFSLLTIFLPVHLGTHLVFYFHLIAPFMCAYCSYMIIDSIAYRPVEGYLMLFVGITMFVVLIHAILVSMNLIPGPFIHEEGFLLLIIGQVLLLAYRHRKVYGEKTKLASDLRHKESDLEMVISDNRIRHQFKQDLLNQIEGIVKLNSDQVKTKLKNFVTDLRLQLDTEDKFDFLQQNIATINKEFEAKLKSEYPELTPSERELCQLIKLNLSVKEIARIRRSSEGAIKTARHRIKSKMGLESLDDLDAILISDKSAL